jgi:hypothetical protein
MNQELLAALTHAPIDLLSFREVREKLHLKGGTYRGLQVGRYQDFTRTFLPRNHADWQRRARVKAMAEIES